MKISNFAQKVVKDAAWYYENRGSITLIVWPGDLPTDQGQATHYDKSQGVVSLRIPSKLLLATLERQGKAKPVKKGSRTRTKV